MTKGRSRRGRVPGRSSPPGVTSSTESRPTPTSVRPRPVSAEGGCRNVSRRPLTPTSPSLLSVRRFSVSRLWSQEGPGQTKPIHQRGVECSSETPYNDAGKVPTPPTPGRSTQLIHCFESGLGFRLRDRSQKKWTTEVSIGVPTLTFYFWAIVTQTAQGLPPISDLRIVG